MGSLPEVRSIHEAFVLALKWELAAEDFYSQAAERFSEGELKDLLVFLMEEEISHQNEIERVHEDGKENLKSEETILVEKEQPDIFKLDEISKSGTKEEVLHQALMLEEAAAENYGVLASRSEGELKIMLERLALFEEGHADKIRKLMSELSIAPPQP